MTPGVTHNAAYYRPSDGNFFPLLIFHFFSLAYLEEGCHVDSSALHKQGSGGVAGERCLQLKPLGLHGSISPNLQLHKLHKSHSTLNIATGETLQDITFSLFYLLRL